MREGLITIMPSLTKLSTEKVFFCRKRGLISFPMNKQCPQVGSQQLQLKLSLSLFTYISISKHPYNALRINLAANTLLFCNLVSSRSDRLPLTLIVILSPCRYYSYSLYCALPPRSLKWLSWHLPPLYPHNDPVKGVRRRAARSSSGLHGWQGI